jgi:hypothetical protein
MTTNYYTDSHKTNNDLSFDAEGFDVDALRIIGKPVEDHSGWLALGLAPGEFDLEGMAA